MILYDFLKKNNLLNPETKLVNIHWKDKRNASYYAFRHDFKHVQVPDTVKILQYRYPTEFKMLSGNGEVIFEKKKKNSVLSLVLEYNS